MPFLLSGELKLESVPQVEVLVEDMFVSPVTRIKSELSLSIAEHTHPELESFTQLNGWEMARLF